MRTTLALDNFLLRKVRSLSQKEGKSLKQMIGELLSLGLKAREAAPAPTPKVEWRTQPMGAKFDITDKDLLYKTLDGGP